MKNSQEIPTQLYQITHIPTGLLYHGIVYAEGKTYLDRFQEHMKGKGGKYIKKLLDSGSTLDDFRIELIGTFPLEEARFLEIELSKTSIIPLGLNGNIASGIVFTEEVRNKISLSKKEFWDDPKHREDRSEVSKRTAKEQVDAGSHNFLGGEIQRKTSQERVDTGTHNFLGGEMKRKYWNDSKHREEQSEKMKKIQNEKVDAGTHPLQGKGQMTALNRETSMIERISKELYYSRKDIYFTLHSEVYKEWKKNRNDTD